MVSVCNKEQKMITDITDIILKYIFIVVFYKIGVVLYVPSPRLYSCDKI